MKKNDELEGKMAVVTGASRGIGLNIANDLVDEGWEVFNISRSRPKIKVGFKTILFDLGKLEEIEKLGKKLPGEVDLLVNNAGVSLKRDC